MTMDALETEMPLANVNRKTHEAFLEAKQALDEVRSALAGNAEALLATLSGKMFRLISLVCREHPQTHDHDATNRCLKLAEECVEVAKETTYDELREDLEAHLQEMIEWNAKHQGSRASLSKKG
jgi:hypothetical protein